MGVSEFFHFESECETCGGKCHFEMQAKIPGSYMRNYKIGDKLAEEVVEAFKKRESEYYSNVLGLEKEEVESIQGNYPAFTILPTHIYSYCKKCGRNDVERLIAVMIEGGVFTQILYDNQRNGSILHGGLVVPGLVLDDDELRKQFANAAKQYFEGPTEEPKLIPCPYCGQPLRTSRAKQCFECHIDWHNTDNVIKHQVEETKQEDGKVSEEVRQETEERAEKAVREALGLDAVDEDSDGNKF